MEVIAKAANEVTITSEPNLGVLDDYRAHLKSTRSGGPKSAQGKVAVRQNAMKHGAYAMIEGIQVQADELQARIIEELHPEGELQIWHAEQIAMLIQRSGQLHQWMKQKQASFLNSILARDGLITSYEEEHNVVAPPLASKYCHRIDESAKLSKEAKRVIAAEEKLYSYKFENEEIKLADALKECDTALYQELKDLYVIYCDQQGEDIDDKEFDESIHAIYEGQAKYGQGWLSDMVEHSKAKIWVIKHAKGLQETLIQRYLSEMVTSLLDTNVIRAESHINRNLRYHHDELRRLQADAKAAMSPVFDAGISSA
jgi:hypothetical protein